MNSSVRSGLLFSLAVFFLHGTGISQVIAGFENFNLARGAHLNNASPEKAFKSGSIELPNFYDPDFDYWSGWAISADTNTTTPGFMNQYSAIAGEGALGTSSYAIGYVFDPSIINLKANAIGKPMIGMYVNNSTYAYYSIRDGDAFAKKFGGESGKDPDFFMLTIKKYAGGIISDDSINIYLADYRSSDPSKDYILSDWRYVDLTKLGEVDSLVLSLTSSDVGIFGMNTPAYLCIDQVSTDNLLSASYLYEPGKTLSINPNPTGDMMYLDLAQKGEIRISNIQGTVTWFRKVEAGQHRIDVSAWARGIYFVSLDGQSATRISVE